MEIDQFKSAWNTIESPEKTTEEIQTMLKENKHPVLKGIRTQLSIEIAGWSAFLVCYYSMFDGDQKPVLINIVLISCILIALIHNLLGYRFSKYLLSGSTLKESLENYLVKIKLYSRVSIASRIIYASSFLLFFTYNIHFTVWKFVLLAAALLIFCIQMYVLYRLWIKRLQNLRLTVESLS